MATTRKLKLLFSRSARKAEVLRGTGLVASVPDRHAEGLTKTQEMFLQWNAERLGISLEDSRRRYTASWDVFPKGHRGRAFDKFNGDFHSLFRVFFEDTPREVFETYKFLGPLHFLTFLTYPEPLWSESDLIVRQIGVRQHVSIMDFGCGLAQQSRTLAEFLRARGAQVQLTLADIPTLRAEFLTWWGQQTGIATQFLPCTLEAPIPALPEFDVCFAMEFFEHVHVPVKYFEHIDAKLRAGGILITGIMDHHAGFTHVSPQLGELRDLVVARGYETLLANRILKKSKDDNRTTGSAAASQ
jgi:2-polyprenyl-3-methyl-5-hydroxy-6-metoxy-1,4-benzoquinol methylase